MTIIGRTQQLLVYYSQELQHDNNCIFLLLKIGETGTSFLTFTPVDISHVVLMSNLVY